MKKKLSFILAIVSALMLSACGNSDSSDAQLIQEENESLKAEISSMQATSTTTVEPVETTKASTTKATEASTAETTEESSVSITEASSEPITEAITEKTETEYRPAMYLEYVRPCAEGIGTMSRSEVEALLTDVEGVEKPENDKYYFYIFVDTEYEYTVRISKDTNKISLVAMSTSGYTFSVYIEKTDSGITYLLDGEYGTGITKEFKEYANSLEESEHFIFSDKSKYLNANTDNLETISLDEYNQLEIGMDYSDVIFIIGGYGERISESEIAGIYTSMYQFEGEGDIGANAVLMFQNGELYSKAQSGLQ